MPDPTKEQFEAAARRVTESAPPGLSKEQFYGLIDKDLQSLQLTDVMKHRAVAGTITEDPADTTPNLLTRVGRLLEPLAHPKSLTDFGNLLIPGSPGSVLNRVVGAAIKPAIRIGLAGAGGVAGVATAPAGASPLNKTLRGIAGAAIGAGVPDAASVLSHTPGITRIVTPLTKAAGRITEFHSPLTVTGREAQRFENARKIYERQMFRGMPGPTNTAPVRIMPSSPDAWDRALKESLPSKELSSQMPGSTTEDLLRQFSPNADVSKFTDMGPAPAGGIRIMPPRVAPKQPVEILEPSTVTASKSKMQSAVPGLSKNDLQAVAEAAKAHPDWTTEMLEEFVAKERGARQGFYRTGGKENLARKLRTPKE